MNKLLKQCKGCEPKDGIVRFKVVDTGLFQCMNCGLVVEEPDTKKYRMRFDWSGNG